MYKKLTCLVSLVLYSMAATPPMHAMSLSLSRQEAELAAIASVYDIEKVKEKANRLYAQNDHDSCLKIFRRAFIIAVMRNKTELVKFFLEKGVDVNAVSLDDSVPFTTPLYYALRSEENEEVIQLLIAHGATIPFTDNKGRTPLYFALKYHQGLAVVSWILEKMPEACEQTRKGRSPLQTAFAYKNDLVVIKEILKRIKNITQYLYCIDDRMLFDDLTLLHVECQKRNTEYLQVLLEAGVSANMLNSEEEPYSTPLYYALHIENNSEAIQTLIAHGATVPPMDDKGRTALYLALKFNQGLEVVSWIISQMPDACQQVYKGQSPLHTAIKYENDPKVIQELLKHIDVAIKDHKNRTPLHRACQLKNSELVPLLLAAGASVTIFQRDDAPYSTPLYDALRVKNNIKTVQTLIAHGATIPPTDNIGRTPLYFALKYKQGLSVVSWIIRQMPEACQQIYNGASPLHTAIQYERGLPVIKELLKYLDINRKDNNNRTPLHNAIRLGRSSIAAFLLTHNPEIDTQDNEGMTPFHDLSSFNNSAARIGGEFLRRNPVMVQDALGRTPLHHAVARSTPGWLMKLVLKYPECRDMKDNEGKTALSIAVGTWQHDFYEINLKIALLLLLGAQQYPDGEGKTPLAKAYEIPLVVHREDIVGILTGARPDIMEQARLMLIKERAGDQNIAQVLSNARLGIKKIH